MQPLRFAPHLKRLRWGGRRLGSKLNKPLGDHSDYAESWEVCDLGTEQSVVCGGPLAGWTLSKLVRERPDELLGVHAGLTQFPLLLKFLDAHDRLSVQVHPNDEQAQHYRPGERGKTEAWIVLAAENEACVYAGLKTGVDRPTLETALHCGSVESCLQRVSIAAGDCLFIPAGTVHAIGAGVLLAEVQQISDITFRLFDWNRLDRLGQPRPLHVAEALDSTDFSPGPANPVVPRVVSRDASHLHEALVSCAYFTIERHTARTPVVLPRDNRCRMLMGLQGVLRLAGIDTAETLSCGQTLLLPASCPALKLSPDPEAMWLDIFWN